MTSRHLTPLDRLLGAVDNALKTVAAGPGSAARPNPSANIPDERLADSERRHAAGLMRVNHAGEVAAQALYQGHAVMARDPEVARHMQHAAAEERDHLAWCEDRLRELGASPSRLSPLWYAGAFAIGAASGALGDRWSLGFVAETERQVAEHLGDHLQQLPRDDARSRAIVSKMREEEAAHGLQAEQKGGAPLPRPLRNLMRASARVMKRSAYWL
jgi:ubiquinone biosynthesis monooxygenase Coq7